MIKTSGYVREISPWDKSFSFTSAIQDLIETCFAAKIITKDSNQKSQKMLVLQAW